MIKLEFNKIVMTSDLEESVVLHSLHDTQEYKPQKSPIKKRIKPIIDKHSLGEEDYNRIVEMAWQDRTHFDVIRTQYGLNENEIKKLMRKLISTNAFKRWRKRVQGRKTKHKKRCQHKPIRFQGPW